MVDFQCFSDDFFQVGINIRPTKHGVGRMGGGLAGGGEGGGEGGGSTSIETLWSSGHLG